MNCREPKNKAEVPKVNHSAVLYGIFLERVTGIEPVTKAWEAAVIPFHHTRRMFWIRAL